MASINSIKAKKWIRGRKNLFRILENQVYGNNKIIWIHAASAGEFEQAKPIIEKLKSINKDYKILVSFFSPSGFKAGKNYKLADIVTYIPLDTAANANKFIETVKPSLVIFIKYDYWYHHLKAVYKKNIPLLIVSAIFRDNQPFFKWYGGLHRKMLGYFNHIFVQDTDSKELLSTIGIKKVTTAGDTRFDRVVNIASNFSPIPIVEKFAEGNKVIVAGSTWKEDEELLSALVDREEYKFIIVPHEINTEHIYQTLSLFPSSLPFSQSERSDIDSFRTIVIDNYGMLSRIYKYATIAYVGGGFNKSGIHNTLEAVVFGKPVIIGPNYKKFKEARELVDVGAGFTVSTKDEIVNLIDNLSSPELLEAAGQKAETYVKNNIGATDTVMGYIQENLLLTR